MTAKQQDIIKELREENQELRKLIKRMKNFVKCPYCSGIFTFKHGIRYNTNKGFIQRYECLSCGKKFSIRNEEFRMRHSSVLINKALEMRKSGLSYAKISEKLGRPVSRQTIFKWQREMGEIEK